MRGPFALRAKQRNQAREARSVASRREQRKRRALGFGFDRSLFALDMALDPICADQANRTADELSLSDVRYWPKADIPVCTAHVRFRG
jgi:hypothetical protein